MKTPSAIPHGPGRCRAASAFTLTEMLVTTAILIILSALLLPVARSAKAQADTAGCLSNLHAMGTAVFSYAADNNGFLVNNTYDSSIPPKEITRWQTHLDPFLDPNWSSWTKAPSAKKSVFRCPSKHDPAEVLLYGLNQELMNTSAEPQRALRYLSAIRSPAHYVLASDTSGSGWVISSSLNKMKTISGVTTRHDGHPNFLYADGHVAPFRQELKGYLDDPDPFYQRMWFARFQQ